MKIAVQLYSLRHIIEAEGLEAALKLVSEAGYDGVEFAGDYGCTPEQTRELLLEKYHLEAVGAHISSDAIINAKDEVLHFVNTLGIDIVSEPCGDPKAFESGEMSAYVEKLSDANLIMLENDTVFCYHNHWFEATPEKQYLTPLCNIVCGLKLEVDVFWLKYSGIDPLKFIKDHRDVIELLHLKELDSSGDANAPSPVLGDGIVGIGEIVKFASEHNFPCVILEAENIQGDISVYLKKCLDYIKANM